MGNGRLLFVWWVVFCEKLAYFVLALLEFVVPAGAAEASVLPVEEVGGDGVGQGEHQEQDSGVLLAAQAEHDGEDQASDGGDGSQGKYLAGVLFVHGGTTGGLGYTGLYNKEVGPVTSDTRGGARITKITKVKRARRFWKGLGEGLGTRGEMLRREGFGGSRGMVGLIEID